MKVNGVGPSKVVNLYNNNKRVESKGKVEQKKDSLEISQAGKSLSAMGLDKNYVSSPEKLEEIKKAIAGGTYKPSSAQIAKKMMDTVKGRDI
jgi:negative regulator of flagellin synthesis FlgM